MIIYVVVWVFTIFKRCRQLFFNWFSHFLLLDPCNGSGVLPVNHHCRQAPKKEFLKLLLWARDGHEPNHKAKIISNFALFTVPGCACMPTSSGGNSLKWPCMSSLNSMPSSGVAAQLNFFSRTTLRWQDFHGEACAFVGPLACHSWVPWQVGWVCGTLADKRVTWCILDPALCCANAPFDVINKVVACCHSINSVVSVFITCCSPSFFHSRQVPYACRTANNKSNLLSFIKTVNLLSILISVWEQKYDGMRNYTDAFPLNRPQL